MTQVRYPATPLKVGVMLLTIAMLVAMLLVSDPIIAAFLCFSSLITAMLHFNVFESTADGHLLNRVDLGIQVTYLVLAIIKAFAMGGG